MTTATRPQLDAVYNIAKTKFNSLNVHNAYLSHLTNIGFPLDALSTHEALTQSGIEPSSTLNSTLITGITMLTVTH